MKWHAAADEDFNCASIHVNKNKQNDNCNLVGDDGQKAKEACPLACDKTSSCTVPKCWRDSYWKPNKKNKKIKNCNSLKDMNKKKRKKYCQQKGRDKKTGKIKAFAYEACEKCGYCAKNKK